MAGKEELKKETNLKEGDILTENSENEILSQSEEEELQHWENSKLKSGNYLTKHTGRTKTSREEVLLKKLRAAIIRP